jgi:putative transposase
MYISLLLLMYLARIFLVIRMQVQKLRSVFSTALRKRKTGYIPANPTHPGRRQAKPNWVKHEIIRLKALLPEKGCRKITDLFNHLYTSKRNMTVGKTYVAYIIQQHRYQIRILRRQLKHRVPRHIPKNHLWAIDLTGKGDTTGKIHSILGIIDHGSRKLLTLETAHSKNAWTLLGHFFLVIGKFGKPRAIRSDNEPVFKSRIFRSVLALVGIHHQFTAPGCPWMNGRIERAFGTLKNKLDRLKINGHETLAQLLTEFSFWYNATRPHQHLNGLTPDEVWYDINPYAHPPKSVQIFSGWGGLLRGLYLRY